MEPKSGTDIRTAYIQVCAAHEGQHADALQTLHVDFHGVHPACNQIPLITYPYRQVFLVRAFCQHRHALGCHWVTLATGSSGRLQTVTTHSQHIAASALLLTGLLFVRLVPAGSQR